jgi:hypothetical protein
VAAGPPAASSWPPSLSTSLLACCACAWKRRDRRTVAPGGIPCLPERRKGGVPWTRTPVMSPPFQRSRTPGAVKETALCWTPAAASDDAKTRAAGTRKPGQWIILYPEQLLVSIYDANCQLRMNTQPVPSSFDKIMHWTLLSSHVRYITHSTN